MLTGREAKRLVDAHLRREGLALEAGKPKRGSGVWVVEHVDPTLPVGEVLCGEGLSVVTDDGEIHDVNPPPDLLESQLMERGLGIYSEPNSGWVAGRSDDAWTLPADWAAATQGDLSPARWDKLRATVDRERAVVPVYPPPGDVFRALRLTPFADVRVVIIGQDPYHGPGRPRVWRSPCLTA